MAEQRPIVYFQRLMGNYDRQVAEIMKAKREYLVFAEEGSEVSVSLIEREPVTVEVLTPTPVPTQVKKKIVELNAPLEEQELFVTIPEPIETPIVPEVMTPATPVVEPIVMTPKVPVVSESVVASEPEEKTAVEEVTEAPIEQPVPEKAPEVAAPKSKAKPMTGLGLNLDSIFNEEFSAEKTGYFGK